MIDNRDRAVAVTLAAAVTTVVLAFSTRQGITRDEAYYMKAGEQYVQYYADALTGRLARPFSDAAITPYWAYNAEHPPLLKTLYGVSWRVLHRCTCAADRAWHPAVARLSSGAHRTLGLFSEVTAFRLPTAVFFGLLCALVYLFFVEAFGSRWGAWAAALLMFAQPRAFFHAQTASFDLPVAALWFATSFAYWRALGDRTWRTAIVAGVLFGLTLATKLQAFLLPAALGLHWIWLMARRQRDVADRALRALLMMAILALPMLFAIWPWLWHDTLRRFGSYLLFHLHHVHYNFEYLGHNYNQPPYPWHEPLGMLLFTAPVVLLVLAAAGIVLLARRPADSRSTAALMLLAGVVPVAIFILGTEPIYGATKHWLATMPFLAIAAGYALDQLRVALVVDLRWAQGGWRETAVSAALVLVAFVPAAAETFHSHPYQLSHYNALAGGPPGGADLGMNRQFWGYSVKGLLPWLNAHAPRGARVFTHDWNYDAFQLYMRQRELRSDIVDVSSIPASDLAFVIHEKHFNGIDFEIWQEYGTVQPVQVLTLDGVPLVSVYAR